MSSRPVVVGVTGASGAVYAQRLVEELLAREHEVLLAVSSAGRLVVKEELACAPREDPWGQTNRHLLHVFSAKDFGAPFCSGSFRFHGMVIIPASMSTVGAVASGYTANCIHRGADVALKEGRKLVVVPRETPFSTVHLENLLSLARAGAVILPPSPAFYQRPASVDDIVDFVVSRVLDALHVDNELYPRWKENLQAGGRGEDP
ncbi:MAG: UbiX family flavin prenyltransferase [Planctomycetota bacterium]|nr:UbiX family flavin prenyltransferase [Planctomycetota bacterium]